MFDFSGKTVLITGASYGLGEGFALAFAEAGADVVLTARSAELLGAVAARCRELGRRATALAGDVAVEADVARVVETAVAEHGRIDVLVNNAGIGVAGALWDLPDGETERTVRLNLSVPLELCGQAIPRMIRRRGGHIVNVASIAAIGFVPGMTAYSGTKAGLFHATAALRLDLAGLPVGLTSVLVGPVPTDMLLSGEASYAPTKRGFDRLRRLQLMPDTAAETLAAAVVKGVLKDRRTVFLPKRAAAFVAAVEAPRRIVELALTGVPRRA